MAFDELRVTMGVLTTLIGLVGALCAFVGYLQRGGAAADHLRAEADHEKAASANTDVDTIEKQSLLIQRLTERLNHLESEVMPELERKVRDCHREHERAMADVLERLEACERRHKEAA